jgi:hypothetical protein
MQPLTITIPAEHAEAIAAEVDRSDPGFAAAERAELVRVWIGPALELVLTLPAADRLADALVDALAADDERNPVLFPAIVNGW